MRKKKKSEQEPYTTKEAFTSLGEKVEDAPKTEEALLVGEQVRHVTFGIGTVIRKNSSEVVIGDFGGTLRTLPIEELTLVVPEPIETTVEAVEEEEDE